MANTYGSMSALKEAMLKEMLAAMEETVDKSFQDIHKNVDHFYSKGRGRYKRTGQLAESPQIDGISGGGDSVTGQLSLDTGYVYNPSGRDTETIYGWAEQGGLLGNCQFWQKSMDDIENNIEESFGKRFK